MGKVQDDTVINILILTKLGLEIGIQFCFQVCFARRTCESHFLFLGFNFFTFEWA